MLGENDEDDPVLLLALLLLLSPSCPSDIVDLAESSARGDPAAPHVLLRKINDTTVLMIVSDRHCRPFGAPYGTASTLEAGSAT